MISTILQSLGVALGVAWPFVAIVVSVRLMFWARKQYKKGLE